MKVFSTQTPVALEALQDPRIQNCLTQTIEMFEEMVVPLYANKSVKQERLDLVHPILNNIAEYWLSTFNWNMQCKITTLTSDKEDDDGTIDFDFELPDGRHIPLEVQFGNRGRMDRDFSKFKKLHRQDKLAFGILVYFDRQTGITADSGLCEYEKAVDELNREYQHMPICVLGLSREDSRTVDLREIPQIVYPSVLGGSGQRNKKLQKFIAKAVVDEVPLSTLDMPKDIKGIIATHARKHVKTTILEFQQTLIGAMTCKDDELRTELVTTLLDVLKQSSNDLLTVKLKPKKAKKPAASTKTAKKPARKSPVEKPELIVVPAIEQSVSAPQPPVGYTFAALPPGASGKPLQRYKKPEAPNKSTNFRPVTEPVFINSAMGLAWAKVCGA